MLLLLSRRLRRLVSAATAWLLVVHAVGMAAALVPPVVTAALVPPIVAATQPAPSERPMPCHEVAQPAPPVSSALPRDAGHGSCCVHGAPCCAPLSAIAETTVVASPALRRAAWQPGLDARPVLFLTDGPLRPPRAPGS